MRRRRLALLVALGVALGAAVEWASYDEGGRALAVADFVVGAVLITCGALAWGRRPDSRVGGLMTLAGATWFLGTLFSPALYLHRGPLVHLHLSYPTGRLPTRLARAAVLAAYVTACVTALSRNDVLTLALSAVVAVTAVQVFVGTSGPARKAGVPALAAALAFAGVLALGAVQRLADRDAVRAVLWTYDVVIATVVVVLLVDLIRGRWADAVVTGLVVDLGAASDARAVRAKLAGALGDPSLVVGYRLPATDRFVDEAGHRVEVPPPGSERTTTPIADVAVLVHARSVAADPALLESVAAAARIAVANPRLQAEARARAEELEASRRRIVEAADAQRRRLAEELRLGAEHRLVRVGALLADARRNAALACAPIAALGTELDEARRELHELAQGIHPAALTEGGLLPALTLLAERSAVHADVTGNVERLAGPVEAAFFFVCSEALANVAKHASARHVSISVRSEGDRVVLSVADDGLGGAEPSPGSGLHGLADRVEALGGRLDVDSPLGGGTRVTAALPVANRRRSRP